jgi:hypothetical protein
MEYQNCKRWEKGVGMAKSMTHEWGFIWTWSWLLEGGGGCTKQIITMKNHQIDEELDAKMWKDKTMKEASTNPLTQMVQCDHHSYLIKHLHWLKNCMFFVNCKWSCP